MICMETVVYSQTMFENEGSWAQGALERSLVQMGFQMTVQTWFLFKPCRAHVAFVPFLIVVKKHVAVKRLKSFERCETDNTGVRSILDVCGLVFFQTSRADKRSFTNFTFVWSTVSV